MDKTQDSRFVLVVLDNGRQVTQMMSIAQRMKRQRVGSVDGPVTAVCALPGGGWIAAVTDGLWQSADGVAWVPLKNGLRGEPVVSLAVVNGQVVAGTAEGKVWVGAGAGNQ